MIIVGKPTDRIFTNNILHIEMYFDSGSQAVWLVQYVKWLAATNIWRGASSGLNDWSKRRQM